MAGMAAEGREIPIADRELTRGRRGTHSDRAHHHRRWFRAPARCRSETGAPPSPRFAQLGVRGFDRLPAVDAGRRPALRRPRAFAQLGYAVSTASRRSMPVGDRRSAVRALLLSWGYAVSTASRRAMPAGGRRSAVPAFCSVGGTRFRPPLGGRCRSETGAPSRPRAFAQLGVRGFDRLPAVDAGRRPALRRPRAFAQSGVRGFDRLSAVDAGRRPALRRPRAFAQLGVRGFDRLSAVDAGRRPALRRPRVLRSWGYAVSTASRRSMPVGDRRSAVRALLLSWGYAVSTASRRSMPVGDRRSAVPAFCSVGVRGFDRLSAVDAGRRPALRRPRACSRSTMRDLDARRAVRNPGC